MNDSIVLSRRALEVLVESSPTMRGYRICEVVRVKSLEVTFDFTFVDCAGNVYVFFEAAVDPFDLDDDTAQLICKEAVDVAKRGVDWELLEDSASLEGQAVLILAKRGFPR